MDNQGDESSGSRGKRHSSLPSSLIPLMYAGPRRQETASSPQLETQESTENPSSSSSPITYIPPSATPAFTLRPIDALPGVPIPDDRRPQPSRLQAHALDREQQESQRAGPSSIRVDTQREPRLGGGATNYVFQPPPITNYASFTFPPVPRYTHLPFSHYEEGEAGPSTVVQGGMESGRRRTATTIDLPPTSVSSWPWLDQDRSQSSLEEPGRHERIEGQPLYEDQSRQDQRSQQTRRPARLASQPGESRSADLPTSVPTYLPVPTQSNPPVVRLQGLQLTHPGPEPPPPPVYYPNPYVSQTQSYTQIAPRYFPRYFDAPPIIPPPPSQDYQLQQQAADRNYESEGGSSVTSRPQGGRIASGPDDGGKGPGPPKGKRTRVQTEEIEDDEEDEAPRRKVPRKTEVACDFCRRRKLRCDGVRPTCRTCSTRKEPCTYVDHVRRRGPGKAPKGSKKLAKGKPGEIDPFASMLDMSQMRRPYIGRPESVASVDTLPRYSPPLGGPVPPIYTISSSQPLPPSSRGAPTSSHLPSQSPGASTSEREAGSSGERRQRKRTASQPDRSKRTRRDPETEGTDDTSHDPQDDDKPFEGQRPP